MALQCTSRTFTKTIVNVRPDWRSTENSSLETFFSKNASLEFIPCDFIKSELPSRDYLAWVLQGTLFNILKKLSLRYHCYFFDTGRYSSTERTRTSQLGLDIYNCVTGNVYIWMPMLMLLPVPRFPNGLLSIYRGPLTLLNFQMAASKPSKTRPFLPAWVFLRFSLWLKF